MSLTASDGSSSQSLVELVRRAAAASREASALRADTEKLEEKCGSLGLLRWISPRSSVHASSPSLDAPIRLRDPLCAVAAAEPLHAVPSAEAYRRLFQTLPMPCLWSDGRGIVRDVNESALRFFNMTNWRLVGKPLIHLVARGDTRPFRELVRGIDTLPDVFQLAVRFRPRGGRPAPRLVRILRLGSGSFGWLLEEPTTASG